MALQAEVCYGARGLWQHGVWALQRATPVPPVSLRAPNNCHSIKCGSAWPSRSLQARLRRQPGTVDLAAKRACTQEASMDVPAHSASDPGPTQSGGSPCGVELVANAFHRRLRYSHAAFPVPPGLFEAVAGHHGPCATVFALSCTHSQVSLRLQVRLRQWLGIMDLAANALDPIDWAAEEAAAEEAK